MRTFSFIGCLLLCVLPLATLAEGLNVGPGNDERLAAGLRERRLFSLAEFHCRQRLAVPTLAPEISAALAVELVRTLAERALHAPPAERAEHWQRATAAAEEFERREPRHPRLVLVKIQAALTPLAAGELLRTEAEVSPGGEALVAQARGELREAVRRLEALQAALELEIPRLRRNPPRTEAEFTADELTALLRHVRFHLARTLMQQGLCYEPRSDDQVNSLTQARQALAPLAQGAESDTVNHESRLAEAQCLRRLGDFAEARRKLAEVIAITSTLPESMQLLAAAEMARIELAAEQPAAALEVLTSAAASRNELPAEFELTRLETLLAAAALATRQSQEAEAQRLQQQAVELASGFGRRFGPYWQRRADMHLARSAAGGSGRGNLEILVRSANELFLQQQFDAAVVAFENASRQARSQGDAARAFALAYQAALVEQQRQNFREAARRLQSLAFTYREHATAPEAHLLAAWNLAQAAQAEKAPSSAAAPQAGRETLLAEYANTLEEHLKLFAASPTQHRARLWLGKLREGEGEWKKAVGAYREVGREASDFSAAVAGAGRCWPRLLEQGRGAGGPVATEALVAVQWFEQALRGPEGAWPEKWNEMAREAALAAVRLRLRYLPGPHREAEGLLQAATAHDEGAPQAWRLAARSLRVAILAGIPERRAAAEALLDELAAAEPDDLFLLATELGRLTAATPAAERAALAQLELRAIDLALGPALQNKVPAAHARQLRLARAEALAHTGQYDAGLALLASLAAQDPGDAELQMRYAAFLAAGESEALLEAALGQWRKVLSRSRPQSEVWWQAKYALAELHFRRGEKDKAAQLIRLSETLNATLGGELLRRKFHALLEKCER